MTRWVATAADVQLDDLLEVVTVNDGVPRRARAKVTEIERIEDHDFVVFTVVEQIDPTANDPRQVGESWRIGRIDRELVEVLDDMEAAAGAPAE